MPLTPGLSPSIREEPIAPGEMPEDAEIIVESGDIPGEDKPIIGEGDKILEIEHPDGSITISLDGQSLGGEEAAGPTEWFDNLVTKIPESELDRIADDLLRGISDDVQSRKEWIEDRAQGMKLLGLKIEIPNNSGAVDGAPVEGMNRVRHPLLLEAVLRFQANARAELLPTDGPVKIRNDDNNANLQEDQLANALERDMNHYLTVTASEYYPDTDRMLLMLGFGGCAFKKVYFCPLRNRPVSETVDADDLIVNNAATDLKNAKRITHRVYMRPSTVKRLQIIGVYRDIDLSTPNAPQYDNLQREKREQQGIDPVATKPEDRDREIYECYCELDVLGYEHKIRGKATGLDIPYRVTIDVSSRKVLSIVRNYDEDSQELPESKTNFVKYTYVPGFGFYDIGLLHILGNTTNAVTAAWRELLDAGMYANFPGFLMSDVGARQNTNIFRVPPGGGALVKTGGLPIGQAIMPLPYKEPSGALMQLVENIAMTGMRVGGTSEQPVTEGRAETPVGTTLAQIEQAQKILNSVHKRLHAAQAQEFRLLVECFKENPGSFWQRNKTPAYKWDEDTFLQAINNCELTPHADPNTASHVQRIMKVIALKQLQSSQPSLYDPIAVDTAALQAIGWTNPTQFLAPPSAQASPPPELQAMQAKASSEAKMADARMMEAHTKAQNAAGRLELDKQKMQNEAASEADKSQLNRAKIQEQHALLRQKEDMRDQDREFKERMQIVDVAQNLAVHPASGSLVMPLIKPVLDDLDRKGNTGLIPPLNIPTE